MDRKQEQIHARRIILDTVSMICKNSVDFQKRLKIEGLIGVTQDDGSVFLVDISRVFDGSGVSAEEIGNEVWQNEEGLLVASSSNAKIAVDGQFRTQIKSENMEIDADFCRSRHPDDANKPQQLLIEDGPTRDGNFDASRGIFNSEAAIFSRSPHDYTHNEMEHYDDKQNMPLVRAALYEASRRAAASKAVQVCGCN